jgi:acetolactate synthase I/II/III large subunit
MLHVERSAAIAQAAELIRNAKRPVILAGHGVMESGAMEQVRTLAERAQIPVASRCWAWADFPPRIRCPGHDGHARRGVGEHAIQEADLLIACGMRFDDRVTGTLRPTRQAKKIHIEVDPAEINKNVKVDVALVGDLREVLEQLLPRIAARAATARRGSRRSKPARARARARHQEPARLRPPVRGARDARPVAHDRRQRHHRHRRGPAPDVGGAVLPSTSSRARSSPRAAWARWDSRCPRPSAQRFACPEKEVWVIAGDGGFQMTAAELATIVQEKIKINIAIINNGYLGMVRQWQEFFYERNYEATPLVSPDFVKLADAHGIPGRAVRKRAEVESAVKSALGAGRVPAQLHGGEGRLGVPDDSRGQRAARDDSPARKRSAGRVGQ